ncbi:MAG TPA: extracellular solute-binding protein [Chloroflexota bacterium]|nr:extracellular solute-binding protein [Chloroflexota bacterium]
MRYQLVRRPTAPRLTRRAFLSTLLAGSGAALLAGCQPASTPPAAPAASAGPAGWEQQWDALVAAAKQEGELVVSGPPSGTTRTELPAAFRNRFGIEMTYLAGNTSDLISRLVAERAAGQYTVDAMLSGAQSVYTVGYDNHMFEPLPPVLIHPDFADPTKWLKGRVWYMDPDQQYIMRVSNFRSLQVWVNTQFVDPGQLQTWQDLLKPEYRGKISVWEPTVPGTGWNTANYLLYVFGEDYVKSLYRDQQPGVTRDIRQISDWLARGSYPISLGTSSNDAEKLKADGFPVTHVLNDVAGVPPMVTAAFGLSVLLKNAPHPNAARLFVNWIGLPEGQEVWNRTQLSVGVRTDVPPTWAPDYIVPQPGVDYFDGYDWDYTVRGREPDKIERMKQLTGRDTPA